MTTRAMDSTTSAAEEAQLPMAARAADEPLPAASGPGAAASLADLPLTSIRPASGWQLINVRELWRYRELLFFLTWRDVKVRYKQTLLGAAWAVLQPMLMMVV